MKTIKTIIFKIIPSIAVLMLFCFFCFNYFSKDGVVGYYESQNSNNPIYSITLRPFNNMILHESDSNLKFNGTWNIKIVKVEAEEPNTFTTKQVVDIRYSDFRYGGSESQRLFTLSNGTLILNSNPNNYLIKRHS